MTELVSNWTLLVYKIPSQPTRLRLQIWRKLQAMGALYLQNAVCLLPARPDLDENLHYVTQMIEETGGTCYLFSTSALLPGSDARLIGEFQAIADDKIAEIVQRLEAIQTRLEAAATPSDLERVEGDLKRERISYLRARRQAYFGSTREAEADERLDALKRALDDLYRTGK